MNDFKLSDDPRFKEFILRLEAKQDWEGMIHVKEIDDLLGEDLILEVNEKGTGK